MYICVKGSEPWAVVGYESLHILRGPRARNPISTDKPPKGDRRFRGMGKVSQRIYKLILQSVRKAFTRVFTKHSQEHSQSTHKSLRKALTRTFAKLSQERSLSFHKDIRKTFTRAFTKLSQGRSQNSRELSRAKCGDFCQRSPAGQTTWSQDSLSIFIYVYKSTDMKHSEPWAHAGYETFLILRGPRAVRMYMYRSVFIYVHMC